MLMDRRSKAKAKMGKPAPNRVNLIGFAGGKGLQEFDAALEVIGIDVNVFLVSDPNAERIDSLPAVRFNVLNPNQLG